MTRFKVPRSIIVKGDPRYLNPAKIVRWIDADTVDLTVEVPFHIKVDQRFRLYGINAYEAHTPGGQWGTYRVNMMAPAGSPVTVRSFPDPDSFGRYLGIIVTPDGQDIGKTLIFERIAFEYYGGTKPIMPEWTGPTLETVK